MAYFPDVLIESLRSSHILGIFLHVDTTPPLSIWAGINDIPAKFVGTAINASSTTFIGGGVMRDVPLLEALINGAMERVEFQLSGLSFDQANILNTQAPPVRGKGVWVGITTLDQFYQPVSDIIPVWSGVASFISERSPPVQGTETPLVTMALTVSSGTVTRSRPSGFLWTDAHHQKNHPGDLFCKQQPRISRGVAPVWPDR
jgi:hypothetical protein